MSSHLWERLKSQNELGFSQSEMGKWDWNEFGFSLLDSSIAIPALTLESEITSSKSRKKKNNKNPTLLGHFL